MGTEKRERQKANREAKLAAEAAAQAKQRRNRTIRNLVILVAVIVVVMLVMSLTSCSKSDSEGSAKGYTSSDDGAVTTTTPTADDGTSSAKATYGTGACAPAKGTDKPVVDFEAAPKKCIDPAKAYTATFTTNLGDVTVVLDTKRTPVTTNNFINLARSGFYDGTKIFRTEASSGIIQGGSPHTQDNSDAGPGYTIPDESLPFASADYKPGSLSMARTSAPNSAGGQFFFLSNEGGRYLGDSAQLGPSAGSYVVFGQTTKGLDVLEKIAALDNGTSAPSSPVTIEKVTISES